MLAARSTCLRPTVLYTEISLPLPYMCNQCLQTMLFVLLTEESFSTTRSRPAGQLSYEGHEGQSIAIKCAGAYSHVANSVCYATNAAAYAAYCGCK